MRQWHGDLFYAPQARAARSTRQRGSPQSLGPSALKKGLQVQVQELEDHEELEELEDHQDHEELGGWLVT